MPLAILVPLKVDKVNELEGDQRQEFLDVLDEMVADGVGE